MLFLKEFVPETLRLLTDEVNVIDYFFRGSLSVVDAKFCCVSSKLSDENVKKTVVDNKKCSIRFHFSKEQMHQQDLVVDNFTVFVSSATRNTCPFAVCQNSHQSQKVADEKKLSATSRLLAGPLVSAALYSFCRN